MSAVQPSEIHLHRASRVLEVTFEDGRNFKLTSEYLRVHSPSAEVAGHGPGQEVLQIGKEDVAIVAVEPVGHYAVKLEFDDGHASGIYTWDYLYRLGAEHDARWRRYLERLREAGHQRKEHRLN